MPRNYKSTERYLIGDPRHGNRLVSKFINSVMYDGKKSTAQRVVYTAFNTIRDRMKDKDPVDVFTQAVNNVRPLIQVRSKRVGGATYQVPMEVSRRRAQMLAIRWILQAIRSRKETTLGRFVKNAIKMLFLSNVVVGLGAFCLTYASIILTGRKTDMVHPSIAFLYIYAMYVLNRFLDKGASTYNDPERAQFYRKHRMSLIVAGVVSSVGALALSLLMGKTIFFTMILLSVMGML